MYKKCCIQIDLKHPTIIIGIFHLIFQAFRIYEIALDLYVLEETIEMNQLTYIVLLTMLQIGIVVSLFVGACKQQHVCLLPWLCFTAPIFLMATVYATLYTTTGDFVQAIFNFIFIGFFWTAWYIVFKYYLTLKTFTYSPIPSYKYSANLKHETL